MNANGRPRAFGESTSAGAWRGGGRVEVVLALTPRSGRAHKSTFCSVGSEFRKRIKSFCGAKRTQKLRWTERGGGWLRRPGLWNFQTRIGAKEALGGAIGRPVAAVRWPLCRWIAGARGWRPVIFCRQAPRLGAPGDKRPWPARRRRPQFFRGGAGLERHGACAHFGESSRTNRRRPARQQGQTRSPSTRSGLEVSSLASVARGSDGRSS